MKVDKNKLASRQRVQFVAQGVVLEHNFGYHSAYLLSHLGCGMSAFKFANLQYQQNNRSVRAKQKIGKKGVKRKQADRDESDENCDDW